MRTDTVTLPSFRLPPQMLKLQAIPHDGWVDMEFVTDDASQAEEMRERMLAFDCVAEVVVREEPGWVSL